jgi:hypothetical protein
LTGSLRGKNLIQKEPENIEYRIDSLSAVFVKILGKREPITEKGWDLVKGHLGEAIFRQR